MSQLSSRARVELAKAALSRIGLEAPELRPYQDEPAQMPSGTVGKDGYLRLEFADRGAYYRATGWRWRSRSAKTRRPMSPRSLRPRFI